MKKPSKVNVTATVEHKYEGLPRFICIPLSKVAPWKITATTTVEGEINGLALGRRSLKHWDDRACWWMDLPNALCSKARIETGDRVKLSLRIASEGLPQELQELIIKNATARQNWERLTVGQQRMLREEILAASQPATRERRARRALRCE
ncbi:MAG TPA: YdeI/OmpD-associated family protein [Pyrinomonadaceae bacterium]|nr:YdeI/OmpD-associated family protein [Pyrinomonadaceae bacterium]